MKTVSSDSLSYTIKDLKAGTVYDFKVRGYSKENGEKYYGEWTTITGATNPANASFNSLKSSKAKTFTAKWDKQSSATGYQIQYSTSSNFSNAKTVKITKNSTTSKTVSSLKSGKKYYVKIRTYKTVKVNGKSKTVYSSWSKAMSVKVK
ncbi:MAG: fibronectin type III domain-containing protein [Clostridia bacterium]|nr:fibronectin type III domain-containing protein [Clostridia bacterium]